MAESRISITRIFGALLLLAGAGATVIVIFLAGRQAGMYHARAMDWTSEVRASGWRPLAERWAALDAVEAFGVLEREEGNAFPLYWPAGVTARQTRCPRAFNAPFESTLWTREDRAMQAAQCPYIDEIARAARMSYLDMSEWLGSAEAGAAGGDGAYFNVGTPLRDISAVLARAHFRILDGDLDGAEADARAVVSSGLHFLRGGADLADMTWASITVTTALDHLRVIFEQRGDEERAVLVNDAMDIVADVRRSLTRFTNTAAKAAGLPDQMHQIVAIAADPDLPVGLRTYSTVMLGYTYIVHPGQVLFGPDRARTEAIASLAARPELGGAVERARKGLEMTFRERIDLMSQMTGM